MLANTSSSDAWPADAQAEFGPQPDQATTSLTTSSRNILANDSSYAYQDYAGLFACYGLAALLCLGCMFYFMRRASKRTRNDESIVPLVMANTEAMEMENVGQAYAQ